MTKRVILALIWAVAVGMGGAAAADPVTDDPVIDQAHPPATEELHFENAEKWMKEFLAHADDYELRRSAGRWKERPLLLVAGRRDEDCPPATNHEPLMRALREAGTELAAGRWSGR